MPGCCARVPTYATALGVRDHDDRIEEIGLAARDRQAREAGAFLQRLNRIPAEALAPADRVNRAILKRNLEEGIEANRFRQRVMLFTTYSGWHQSFAGLADNLPFRTKADYESYLTRLALYPKQNDAALDITGQAVRGGFVLPCSVLGNYEKGISGVIAEDPAKSRFYEPFTRARPGGVSAAEWTRMQARRRRLIADVLNPAYAKHLAFYRTTYLPRCAKSDSISAQPGGREYYAFRVRQETTTDLTADQIHTIGLGNRRGSGPRWRKVAKAAGFAGREAFIRELRTNPKYYATSPAQLMQAAAATAKTVDGKMPASSRPCRGSPTGVREIPPRSRRTTTAITARARRRAAFPAPITSTRPKLNQRPLWECRRSAHEAVPGHHHQIALQQEVELPPFRRHFTFFTAFTEGWGLYSERSRRRWASTTRRPGRWASSPTSLARARLVVDTGIHAKGWNKARAVAFMRENTALSTPISTRSEPLHQLARPGARLQDRRAPHQGIAGEGGNGARREVRPEALPRLGAAAGVGAAGCARGSGGCLGRGGEEEVSSSPRFRGEGGPREARWRGFSGQKGPSTLQKRDFA
jgi:uncharacterized protein (DUF885 family)